MVEEVARSAARLGTWPDFVLLHNPEMYLAEQKRRGLPITDAWDEMETRIREACTALTGVGVHAGVSGNFLSCSFGVVGGPNRYKSVPVA